MASSYTMRQHKKGTLPIVGYISPPCVNNGFSVDLINDYNYALLKSSGINTIVAYTEFLNAELEKDFIDDAIRAMKLCKKYGISYIATPPVNLVETEIESKERLKNYIHYDKIKNNKALGGIVLRDEPWGAHFELMGRIGQWMKELFPKRLVWSNAFPKYVKSKQLITGEWSAEDSDASTEDYKKYLDDFTDYAKPEVLSFDNYPLRAGTDIHESFIENLKMVREKAEELNIPFWSFICTCSFGEMRTPTLADVLWCVNVSLACGAKGIEYFTYVCPPAAAGSFSGGIVSEKGDITSQYNSVVIANRQAKASGKVLMNSKFKGLIYKGESPVPILDENLKSYGALKNIKCEHSLVGCFDYKKGNSYYIINNSVTENDKINLTLTGKKGYYIKCGVKLKFNNELKLTLEAGEGVLLVVKK